MESAGAVAFAASGALGEFGFGWNISPRVVDDDTPRDAAGCAATGVWRAGADARSNGRTVPAAQPAPRTSGGESPGRTKALLLLSVLSKSSRYGIAGMRSNGPGIGPSFRLWMRQRALRAGRSERARSPKKAIDPRATRLSLGTGLA